MDTINEPADARAAAGHRKDSKSPLVGIAAKEPPIGSGATCRFFSMVTGDGGTTGR